MDDWRLRGQEDYLSNATLYRVRFPEFWQLAYKSKNRFYQKIADDANADVTRTGKGAAFLVGEEVRHFCLDHCEFCWEKAYTDKVCEFYCT